MAIPKDAASLFMLMGNVSSSDKKSKKRKFLCFTHNIGKNIAATISEMGPPAVTS
jgi:hypothetical protein